LTELSYEFKRYHHHINSKLLLFSTVNRQLDKALSGLIIYKNMLVYTENGEGTMSDKDAEEVASRFMAKLEENGFTIARSQNSEADYDEGRQARDSRAVEEFIQTDCFQYIKGLK
jgi:hypothetical protein